MKRTRKPKSAAPAATPPRSDRRTRRSAEIRERLFRAALKLFASRGFNETRIEEITEAADVGKGTFFNYFPSKEHVLLAFGAMQVGKLQASVEEARETGEPMPEFLRRLCRVMSEEPGRDPGIVRTILMAYLLSPPVRETMQKNLERARLLLAELFTIGQKRGELRSDVPAIELARVFHQTAFGTLMMWSLAPEAPLSERVESALTLLWTGVEAPRSVPAPLAGQ